MSELGYGREVWCTDRVSSARLVEGGEVVAQAVFRRFITPRGMLSGTPSAAAYGLDLAAYVGQVGEERAARALPSLARAEALKDDRVADAVVRAAVVREGAGLLSLTMEIDLYLHESTRIYTLTIQVGDAAATLEGVTTQ